MTTSSTLKKIGFASFIMMASVFASRLIGLVRESTIAMVGGNNAGVDAYQVAFVIPEILNHVVASGFLSITFIPIFATYIKDKNEAEGYRVFSIVMNGCGTALLGFIVLSMIFTPELIGLLAPGLTDPVTVSQAVRMTRIIIPAQFFFFCGGLFMAVQFAGERFFIPALSPLIYNLGIIAGGTFLHPLLGMEGFAWGVLGGAFGGAFLLQWFGARKAGLRYHLTFNLHHPDFIKYILLTLPLMLGLTMTFSTEVLMKFFGSFLNEGSISAMNYAFRVMVFLVGFFGQAVGTASYPYLARLAAQKDFTELNRVMNQTLKFVFLVIPFSVFFMVVRYEVVSILFKRGAFDQDAVTLTAGILPFFLVGTFAFSAQTIVSRGYYATQNTILPALFSTVAVLAGLPIIYAGMTYMGVKGLALGLALSAALTCFFLFEAWSRKSENTQKTSVYLFFFKMVGLSLGLGMILYAVYPVVSGILLPGKLWTDLTICALLGLLFLTLLGLAGRMFRIPEIHTLYGKLFRRLLPWGNKKH
ncbi:MAG TPA: murein biosynthesis integral membrane protein MurJ [Desulfobacteraceae bacterium]|nr:murein biosynthesis integral membrane protein MurJ [Desulfobacteraceae bacterium]